MLDELRRRWHEEFGHPRPWLVLDGGTYCASCHGQIQRF